MHAYIMSNLFLIYYHLILFLFAFFFSYNIMLITAMMMIKILIKTLKIYKNLNANVFFFNFSWHFNQFIFELLVPLEYLIENNRQLLPKHGVETKRFAKFWVVKKLSNRWNGKRILKVSDRSFRPPVFIYNPTTLRFRLNIFIWK